MRRWCLCSVLLLALLPACVGDCDAGTCASGCCQRGTCYEGSSTKGGAACPAFDFGGGIGGGTGGGSIGGGSGGAAGGGGGSAAEPCLGEDAGCVIGSTPCCVQVSGRTMACVESRCSACSASLEACDDSTPCCAGPCENNRCSGYPACGLSSDPCNATNACCVETDTSYSYACRQEHCQLCLNPTKECSSTTECCPGLVCRLRPGFTTVLTCQEP